jgi:hypothetical protein
LNKRERQIAWKILFGVSDVLIFALFKVLISISFIFLQRTPSNIRAPMELLGGRLTHDSLV